MYSLILITNRVFPIRRPRYTLFAADILFAKCSSENIPYEYLFRYIQSITAESPLLSINTKQ